jgi:uncharacterized protein with GYD domain
MPRYVLLMSLTERGVRDLTPGEDSEGQELAGFEAALRDSIENLEGSGELQLFWTLGAFDLVAITELESDAAAAGVALWLAQTHGVKTTTMPAFTNDDVTHSEDDSSVYDLLYRCHFRARFRGPDDG